MLSTELEYGSPRVQAYDDQRATADAQLSADLLDEARDVVTILSAKYQQDLQCYHDRQVRGRSFNVSDLVLRRVMTTKDKHKLSPPWEGPYIVAQVLRPGTYRLKDSSGNVLPNAWNIDQLCRFYP